MKANQRFSKMLADAVASHKANQRFSIIQINIGSKFK